MNQQLIPDKSPDLIWREQDDGTVIVSLDDGQVYVVNEVGALVWQLMDGHNSVQDISQQIASKFDVSAGHAAQDVENFLAILEQKNILDWK